MSRILKILLLVPGVLLISHILIHTLLLEQMSSESKGITYVNKKWEYTLELTDDWRRTRKLISQVFWLTNTVEFTNDKADLILESSFNEFRDEDNRNLQKFVADEAEYGKIHQNISTVGIEKVEHGRYSAIVWKGMSEEFPAFNQYYIHNPEGKMDNVIYKLTFYYDKPLSSAQMAEIDRVLNQFTINEK